MDGIVETLQYLELTGEVKEVESSSRLGVNDIKELYDASLVEAIDVSSLVGPAFIKVRINVRGREWLNNETSSNENDATQANEVIIDVKPDIMGIGLNVNAAWKRWRGR